MAFPIRTTSASADRTGRRSAHALTSLTRAARPGPRPRCPSCLEPPSDHVVSHPEEGQAEGGHGPVVSLAIDRAGVEPPPEEARVVPHVRYEDPVGRVLHLDLPEPDAAEQGPVLGNPADEIRAAARR